MPVTNAFLGQLQSLVQTYLPYGWQFRLEQTTDHTVSMSISGRGDAAVFSNQHATDTRLFDERQWLVDQLPQLVEQLFESIAVQVRPRVEQRIGLMFDTVFQSYVDSLEGALPMVGAEYPQAIKAFLRQVKQLNPQDFEHLQLAYELSYGYWREERGEDFRSRLRDLTLHLLPQERRPMPRGMQTVTEELEVEEQERRLNQQRWHLAQDPGATYGTPVTPEELAEQARMVLRQTGRGVTTWEQGMEAFRRLEL